MTGSGAVHVTTQRRHYTGKDGQQRVYETHLLRRSWREGGKVRNETVANLSKLPAETIELIRRSLAGERFVPAGAAAQVARSLPHGHAAAVHAMARKLGFPDCSARRARTGTWPTRWSSPGCCARPPSCPPPPGGVT